MRPFLGEVPFATRTIGQAIRCPPGYRLNRQGICEPSTIDVPSPPVQVRPTGVEQGPFKPPPPRPTPRPIPTPPIAPPPPPVTAPGGVGPIDVPSGPVYVEPFGPQRKATGAECPVGFTREPYTGGCVPGFPAYGSMLSPGSINQTFGLPGTGGPRASLFGASRSYPVVRLGW